jgi:hypothetical protein
MLKGHSLRKSAELVGVSCVTLFYWRHKLLRALQKIDISSFQGIVEMDETYFLYEIEDIIHCQFTGIMSRQ